MATLKPQILDWAIKSWNEIQQSNDGKLSIKQGFNRCHAELFDPFNEDNQEIAEIESAKNGLTVYDEIFREAKEEE